MNSLNSTSILHAVRVLLAFAANVYEQCVTEEISIHRNVETKSDKMLHESPSKRYIMAQHECPTDCCIFRFIIDGSSCMQYDYLNKIMGLICFLIKDISFLCSVCIS